MSLLYIIDGYNVIKSSPLFSNKKLKDARSAFLSHIDLHRPCGSFRNRVIVVFDGAAEVYGLGTHATFEVIFSQGESADEKIKKMVASSGNPKSVVVITNDKELAFAVRSGGAKVMGTDEFLKKKCKADKERASKKAQEETELNIVQKEKITQELSRIWLNKKSS